MAADERDRRVNRLVDRRLTGRADQDGRAVTGRALSKTIIHLDSPTGNIASLAFQESTAKLTADTTAALTAVVEAYKPLLQAQNVSFTFVGHASWKGARNSQTQNTL